MSEVILRCAECDCGEGPCNWIATADPLSEWVDNICAYELDGGEGPRLCDLLSPGHYAQFKTVLRKGLQQYAAVAHVAPSSASEQT